MVRAEKEVTDLQKAMTPEVTDGKPPRQEFVLCALLFSTMNRAWFFEDTEHKTC